MLFRAAEQKLAPYRDCAITREKLELSHAETSDAVAALLKCLEPGSKVGELMQPHAPALFGLWLVGGVRFDEKGSKRTGATPVTAEQLRELLARQAKLNHFQVLGVSPNVAPLEIRPAFVRLAKLYHPDRFRGVPSELAALAAEVFARISTAHDTLTDPQARQVYESELQTGKSAEQQRQDVRRIREAAPGTTIEVLTPDFRNKEGALEAVIAARPDVFNHNLETVPRLYRTIRPGRGTSIRCACWTRRRSSIRPSSRNRESWSDWARSAAKSCR